MIEEVLAYMDCELHETRRRRSQDLHRPGARAGVQRLEAAAAVPRRRLPNWRRAERWRRRRPHNNRRSRSRADRLPGAPCRSTASLSSDARAWISRSQRTPLSRRHAVLRTTSGGLLIEDLESLNGTFVNETRISAATAVSPNDEIRIGASRLKLILPAPRAGGSNSDHRHRAHAPAPRAPDPRRDADPRHRDNATTTRRAPNPQRNAARRYRDHATTTRRAERARIGVAGPHDRPRGAPATGGGRALRG